MTKYLIDRVSQMGEKPNDKAVKKTAMIASYLLGKGYDLTWNVDRSIPDYLTFYLNVSGNVKEDDSGFINMILTW